MSRSVRSYIAGALAVAGAGLVGSAFIPQTAHADEWNKKSIVHVQEPIIVGNRVLQPGTYVWRLMDSQADRHIVQVFDSTGQHLQTTVLAIPDYRLHPEGHVTFTFWETPTNVPKAVQAWFYPGDNFGQEFPYPKKLVAQLASAAPVPVPTEYKEPEPAPQPQAQAEPAPAPAPQPEPQVAQNEQPAPQAAPAPQAQPAPQALPHTATENTLYGIFGTGSLGLAGLLAFADRRRAKQESRS